MAGGGARALDLGEQFQLHGYGDLSHEWSKVDTSDRHLGDREVGSNLSLVGAWQINDRAKAWGQLFRSSELGKVRVDWAFIDYQATGAQTWRLGRIRLPFGMHNEIRDVQALRPTASMPYMYDEELALIDESFDGASLEQNFYIGTSAVKVEVFGAARMHSGGPEIAHGPAVGARLILETPVEGVSLRGSVYHGRMDRRGGDAEADEEGPEQEEGTRRPKRAWALGARYMLDTMDLQAEMARGFLYDHKVSTWYLQAAVPFAGRWKAAARIESMVTNTDRRGDDAFREKRLVLSLAYSISQNFGLRLEQQFHRGYAIPVVHETVEAGEGRHSWTSTLFSVNYQF